MTKNIQKRKSFQSGHFDIVLKTTIFSCLNLILIFLYLLVFLGCSNLDSQESIKTTKAFRKLTFTRPVDLQQPLDTEEYLYIVEQAGKIYKIENNLDATQKILYLDIEDLVNDSGNEEGLLGLAFHPDFKNNGFLYVDYTASNPKRTVIARFQNQDTPEQIKSTEQIILEFDQPYSNHNGGRILFGPDRYLYIGAGDGGSANDPHGNGQNRTTFLGSILRIDVNSQQANRNYIIPQDNPFAGNTKGFKEEIFAFGLRNPWRFSFHPETGELWVADVGQNRIEEIDIVTKGGNYGWNYMEGTECFSNQEHCDDPDLIKPIYEYDHSVGQSITGGIIYNSDKIPQLKGAYIYGDFVAGKIWALYTKNGKALSNELLNTDISGISSFGFDSRKNIFILSFDGSIYTFEK